MRFERLNAIIAQNLGLSIQSEHQRHVRAVDVGIEQSNFVPHRRKRNGEVYRERGLSRRLPSRTNGNDGIDSGQRLRSRGLLSGTRGHRSAQGITFQIRGIYGWKRPGSIIQGKQSS